MNTLSIRLAELRTAQGLSQAALARILGVSRGAVHNWEAGHRTPTLEQASALATALGCTVDELIRPTEGPSTWPTADDLLARAFGPSRPPASDAYRLGVLAELRCQTGEADRVMCPYDEGTAEATEFAAGRQEAQQQGPGPGVPEQPRQGPRLRQDPADWARGYQDGFRDRQPTAEPADGLAYASGRLEGEADRLAGAPRARLAHLLTE